MHNTKIPGTSQPRLYFTTKRLVLIALITAITCILAPLAVPLPFSPVPITLTNLVIMISVYLLDWRGATISYLVYLLLGLAGLPVFSGFAGGFGKLAGPTGGYLIGFIFMTLIAGLAVAKFPTRRLPVILSLVTATAVTYAFGTFWLARQMNIGFLPALAIGVVPYIPGDLIKIIIALLLGPLLRKRLRLRL